MKLLIIEDEKDIRGNIVEIFEESGFEVLSADNGMTGIKLAAEEKPDLIICDIIMPGINGFEVKKILNIDRATSAIPFIFLTARADIKDMREAMELSADDYIIKPVRTEDLLNLVNKRLDHIRNIKIAGADLLNEEYSSPKISLDDKLFFKNKEETFLLPVNRIVLIKAEGDYTNIYFTDGKKSFIKRSLKNWEASLPDKNFLRVHRSTIINIDHIEKINPWFNGTFTATLKGFSETIYFSQRYSQKLKKIFSL
ncbi:MAG: response regulator transcription factor [Ignavibacteriales bacterium]|nr:response regulator transcription factor [Ignavibacteriales bacterium]